MIDQALDYIRKEVRTRLGVDDSEVLTGSVHALKDQDNAKGAYISVVNLQEETALRNSDHVQRRDHQIRYQEPPVHLNLYLLFAFEFQNYGTSLLRLSQTIELFQSRRVLTAENASPANPFPDALEKLVFDFYNLDFEQMNHLWGVLGGTYFPSVLYKVRMVLIQRDEDRAGVPITSIRAEVNVS
jgi:hypothetical protein